MIYIQNVKSLEYIRQSIKNNFSLDIPCSRIRKVDRDTDITLHLWRGQALLGQVYRIL